MRLVLASASPARLSVLRAAGVEPEVRVSGVDEEAITASTPSGVVMALAAAKAAAVVRPGDDDLLVLGCDSMLDLDGAAYGKPGTAAEATKRWELMAGRAGVLRTGHALLSVRGGSVVAQAVDVAATVVRFGTPSRDELAAYVATGEPLEVAGAFTIDSLGAPFITSVDGDPHAVVGLSLSTLRSLLLDFGVEWPSLW